MQCVIICTEDDTYGNINQFIMSIRQLIKKSFCTNSKLSDIYRVTPGRQYGKYNFFMWLPTELRLGRNKNIVFDDVIDFDSKGMKKDFTVCIAFYVIGCFT